MNHEVERSLNVLIDKNLATNVLAPWSTDRSQSTVHCHEEERARWKQKLRAGEWGRRPDSLSKRLRNRLLSIMHSVIDEGRIVLPGLRPRAIPSTRLEHALFDILKEVARDG